MNYFVKCVYKIILHLLSAVMLNGWSTTAYTLYPKKYAHGFCFAVLCCGYILTDFPISIRLTSLALWLSNDCPSASKATLMNMDKYFMWIHHERLHNNNKAKHNKTVCIFFGIYCMKEFRYGSVMTDLFQSKLKYSPSYGVIYTFIKHFTCRTEISVFIFITFPAGDNAGKR